jgi:tetratricopeptide (TPR) repeat protein
MEAVSEAPPKTDSKVAAETGFNRDDVSLGRCLVLVIEIPMPHVIAALVVACGLSQPLDARASLVAERVTHNASAAPQAQTRTDARSFDAYYEFMLGRHLEAAGNVEGAIKALKQAAAADPSSAEIPAELASLFARQNRLGEARTSAEAALTIDQANVEAHRVLGMVHASLAHLEDPAFASDPDSARHAADAIAHLEAAGRVPGRQPEPGMQLLLGRLYVATRQFGRAVPVLEDLLQQEPGIADAVALLAEGYQGAGRPADAVALMADAATAEPRFYLPLAELYERMRQWKDAANAYEQAVEQFPRNGDLKTRWAMALLSMSGDVGAAKARDVLGAVLKDNPADARALYLLAQAQHALNDLDGAEASARRLIELRPTSAWGPEVLAQVLAERHQYDKVIALLQPLVSGDRAGQAGMSPQESASLLVHLGFAYQERGQLDQALASFEQARRQSPSDRTMGLYLAQARLEAGQTQAALDLIREVRAAAGDDPRLARFEAEALRRSGRLDEGASVLKKTISANPGDPEAYAALAELYVSGQKYAEALDVLADAQRRFPDDLSLIFQQGAALERAKRFDEAEGAFRRVIARDPLHALALNYLGYMMADRGVRVDEAIGFIKRALAIDPQNGAYLDSLGWAYFRQNRLDLAETNLRAAADLRARDSAIQDHYGDLLEKLNRHADAVRAWERALAGDGEQIDRAAIQKKIKSATEKIKPR